MATIEDVVLKITRKTKEKRAVVDVRYEIVFDAYDQASNQPYAEVCRVVGDDTIIGDPPSAGADDTLGFVTPMFFRSTQADGEKAISRHWTRTFHLADLNEDRGAEPNPDELRAVVSLTPVLPQTVSRESNLVKLRIS